MKKKVLMRCLIGAPLGLLVTVGCNLLISWEVGDGTYYAVVPELIEQCGTELNAVLLQTLLTLYHGAVWGGSSVIFEAERRSILWQTVAHLAFICVATFPTVYFLHWMPHTAVGIACYYGRFLGLYFCIWLIQYTAMRWRIARLNKKIRENNGGEV